MNVNSKTKDRFFLTRNLIVAAVIFLLIVSGLAVITNTAINLITVSRNYTALIANWNQANRKRFQRLKDYTDSGLTSDYQKYVQSQHNEQKIRKLISSLFEGKPQSQDIYRQLSDIGLNKHEITKLITNFHYFQKVHHSRDLRKFWNQLESQSAGMRKLASSAKKRYAAGKATETQKATLLQKINSREKNIGVLTQNIYHEIGSISAWISRMALWLTVILGILLVLAGVVFSVRGWKSINKWEEILRERDFLASFPEMNPNPVLQINSDGKLDYVNPATAHLFPDINLEGFKHIFLKDVPGYLKKEPTSETNTHQQVVQTNGSYFLQHIQYRPDEAALRIDAQEITQRMEKEEQLHRSLKEKEVLLSEIHHRVKNNLAVVAGLLEIQKMNDHNPESALEESQSRIKSMAMIHEILYEAESFSEIPFDHYVNKLINQIRDTYVDDHDRISIYRQIDRADLNINQAVPCGLILNELLSNALLHAYQVDEKGRIEIQFTEKEGKIDLLVQDYGEGMPDNFSLSGSKTTGFTIVRALTKQLKADVSVSNQPGAMFHISFQKSNRPGSHNAEL